MYTNQDLKYNYVSIDNVLRKLKNRRFEFCSLRSAKNANRPCGTGFCKRRNNLVAAATGRMVDVNSCKRYRNTLAGIREATTRSRINRDVRPRDMSRYVFFPGMPRAYLHNETSLAWLASQTSRALRIQRYVYGLYIQFRAIKASAISFNCPRKDSFSLI